MDVEMNNESNRAYVSGIICSPPVFSHELYGEGFHTFNIEVSRLSSQKDILPITVSERLINGMSLKAGENINISGQLRSYNKFIDGRSRLFITVFARDISNTPDEMMNPNQVYLEGHLCKPPIYRTTPFNREITDMLLAVNRAYGKSDYIPCITWGRNARFSEKLNVGDKIRIWGRLQSRDYQKKTSEGEVLNKVAYEVSVAKMYVNRKSELDLEIEFENEELEEFRRAE